MDKEKLIKLAKDLDKLRSEVWEWEQGKSPGTMDIYKSFGPLRSSIAQEIGKIILKEIAARNG